MTVSLAGGAPTRARFEWWVPVLPDGPFSRVDVSIGGSYVGVDLTAGLYVFSDFLDVLLAGINLAHSTAYTWSWYSGDRTRQLQIDAGGGDPAIAITWSQSMADMLGFDNDTTLLASTHRADTAPDGLVDVRNAVWFEPEPLRETNISRYRYGRIYAYPWGSGTVYRLTAVCDRDGLTRLLEGPIQTGRTRIHQGDTAYAMSARHTGGYIDGYVFDIKRDPIGKTETWYQLSVKIVVPPVAERATDIETDPLVEDTSFWAWTRYGFSVAHYLRLQGIPRAWSELDLGWVETDWDWDAGLILDGSGRVGYEIDRTKGVGRSASLDFGILDPTNASDLFRRPTHRFTLAQDLAVDDDDAVVLQDASALPTPGKVYIGLECLEVDSVGGVDNTILADIGVKRGTWGPAYTYTTKAVTTFRTLSDRPTVWHGRIARLTATLVDPYGRPVDTAPDGAHSRDVFLGALDGNPMWTGAEGRWDFSAHSLERRLTRKAGAAVSGETVGLAPGDALRQRLVYVEGEDVVIERLKLFVNGASPGVGTGIDAIFGGATDVVIVEAGTLRSVGQIVDTICQRIVAEIDSDYGYSTAVWADPAGWEEPVPGIIVARILARGDGLGMSAQATLSFSASAHFMGATLLECVNQNFGAGIDPPEAGKITIDTNAATAIGYYNLFVRESPPDFGTDAFPDSGYAIVEGSDGDELVKYDAKTTVSGVMGGNVYRLRVTHRKVDGTPTADFSAPGNVVRGAVRLEGTPAEVMLKLLESSSYGDRGSYDDTTALPSPGQGYALGTDYVDEESILTLGKPLSLMGKLALVLGKEYVLDTVLGDFLASQWLAIAPVRGSDGRLRIGLARTDPIITPAAKRLGDSHLMGQRPVNPRGSHVGPTTVEIKMAESTDQGAASSRRVFRSVEAQLGQAGATWTFEWHGVAPMFADSIAVKVARALLERSEQFLTMEVTAAPWHDWQPGDAIVIDSEHPGFYNYGEGTIGAVDLYGRVLGAPRATDTGLVTLSLLVDGAQLRGVLCPGVVITAKAGDVLSIPAAYAHLFQVGESVTVYTPGYTGTERETLIIGSKSGGDFTMTGTPASWVGAGSVMTYQDQDVANARQGAYVQVADGSIWS